MAVALGSGVWEESATESLLAHTTDGSLFKAHSTAVHPIEETELSMQGDDNLLQESGCVPSYTCGASKTENCCDYAVAYDVTKVAKLTRHRVHRMYGKKAIANMLSPLGKVDKIKDTKAARLTEAAMHNTTNTTHVAGKTAKVMSKVLKRFGLSPGSHLSGKAKAAKAVPKGRRRKKFYIPPATSDQAHYDKVTGAYHLGHNRRRVGAGFALERHKFYKEERKAKKKARGSLPGILRKEFPRNLWHRKANSTKYEKLSVKDLFSNRSYYRGAGHRGVFKKKGVGKDKNMTKTEKTIIKDLPKGK
jgi:hypothetical protein